MEIIVVERALSVKQPAASAIMSGAKNIENRTAEIPKTLEFPFWAAIHASKTPIPKKHMKQWETAFRTAGIMSLFDHKNTPRGVIIGLAKFVEDLDVDQNDGFSNWSETGKRGWRIQQVIELPEHIPILGKQTLFWKLPDEIKSNIRKQFA